MYGSAKRSEQNIFQMIEINWKSAEYDSESERIYYQSYDYTINLND